MSNARKFAPPPVHHARLRVVVHEGTPVATTQPKPKAEARPPALDRVHRGLFVVPTRPSGAQFLEAAFRRGADVCPASRRSSGQKSQDLQDARRIVAQVEQEIARRVARERAEGMHAVSSVKPVRAVPTTGRSFFRRVAAAFGW